MKEKQQAAAYPLRLPATLRRALQALADANHRSLAGEIVYRLENAVAATRQGAQQ